MLLAAAVALALLVPSQRAIAKEVFFDPDSPAGKEYALPLDQARDEAAGVGKSDGPAGEKAPPFGEGVSRGGSGPGPGTDGGGTAGIHAGALAGNGARAQGRGSERLHAREAAAAISSAGGDYALSSAILWIAAILALGGIVGLVLRAVQRLRPA